MLTQPGQPDHDLLLSRRSLRECIAEELRRLDEDRLYGGVITEGWNALSRPIDAAEQSKCSREARPFDRTGP